MKITIKDVAKKAGVSVTSVSQVLNNKDIRISEEKRKQILDAVTELNYTPNPFASKLKSKKSNTIGLIVPDITNLYFMEIAKGIVSKSKEFKLDVIISDSDNKSSNDIGNLEKLRKNGVDGIIIAVSQGQNKKLNKLIHKIIEKDKIPIVLLDRDNIEYNCHAVMVNNFLGGYIATKHLIELGHRKIGCITGPLELQTSYDRYRGYKSALEESNITLDQSYVTHGDFKIESGYESTKKLLEKDITAIFACNDMMAYGVYKRLKEVNIKVPDNISVIGFDNVFFSEIVDVPLTTIGQPILNLGEKAVQILVDNFNSNYNEKISSVFEPYLVTRSSTTRVLDDL